MGMRTSPLILIFKGKVNMVRAKGIFTWCPTFLGLKEGEYKSDDESDHGSIKVPAQSNSSEVNSRDDGLSDIEEVSETVYWEQIRFTNTPFIGCAASEAIGNSGGILCVWEASVFKKDYATLSDNFIAIYGTWLPSNSKVLFVAIYAPQQASSKRILWDYMATLVSRWNGEVIMLGDFNKVRNIDERRGSVFNPASARVFNNFILTSGLVDVKMEGYAFTWSHPSGCLLQQYALKGIYLIIGRLFFVRFMRTLDRLLSGSTILGSTWRDLTLWSWVKDQKLKVVGDKNSIKNELIDIDRIVDSGTVSDTNLIRRAELHRKLHEINSREAKDYIQKSKVKWAIEGDENSKFFHGLINKKRSQLAIRGIFVDGTWCTNPTKVKEAFLNHFEARFKKPDIHRLVLNFTFDKRLSNMQAADLDRVVSRDEIRLAVWDCGENKSPGPDGYSFEFFKKYWNLVGPDLCDAIEHFFETGVFPNGCNSSFVALIPKVTDAKFVNDFRPISLIGSMYKVVTKVLANRLALVISDLISDTQSAFVANRQILDGPFILNELLHWCKRQKKQAMFFKVDFAKAYDSVRWDYLLDVLKAFGFVNGTWCKWIRGTFSSAKASVLVNGSPTSEFPFYCGLKQGDPLSPYLFILVMESLHLSFNRAINEGIFKGVMVGECMSRIKAWTPTLDKLRSRLSKWKMRTLSIGGRLTLLKAVLGASPLYNLSIFKILASNKNGGLGVSSFHALNRALLLKWVWRFISQDGSMWFRVIKALYGPSITSHPVNLSSNWCSIIRELHLLEEKGFNFLAHCKKRIGNGGATRFWYDQWLGDQPLRIRFPRLFALETDKEMTVAAKMHDEVSVSFRRPVDLPPRGHFNGSDGEFRVKEVRNFLDNLFLPSHVEPTRWVKYIPIKINVFAWKARRDFLPTRVNLILASRGRNCSFGILFRGLYCSVAEEDI
ncbi:RNA-directed DNA polymerase, eukaryota [Tanacetum coccineum]